MTLRQAQTVCTKLDAQYGAQVKQVKWNDVFSSEEELVEALANVFIPKGRIAPIYTFRGYEYIYSFAYYVQKGWTLSEKQMKQAKRLALEIKKAAAIKEYRPN